MELGEQSMPGGGAARRRAGGARPPAVIRTGRRAVKYLSKRCLQCTPLSVGVHGRDGRGGATENGHNKNRDPFDMSVDIYADEMRFYICDIYD